MKILLLGSQLGYNLEHFVKMTAERLGCEVRFVGYRKYLGEFATPIRVAISRSNITRRFLEPFALRKFNEETRTVASEFGPDLVLSIKGEAVSSYTLKWFSQVLGCTTALWYPDDPRYFDSLSRVIAPYYDFVFTSSEKFVSRYHEAGSKNVAHLPFACEPTVHKRVVLSPQEKNHLASDICFVGTFSPKRARTILALQKAGFNISVWGDYWRLFRPGQRIYGPAFGFGMTKIFNAAKIVLNIHTSSDLAVKPNMRVFEAAGCGSLLLTDRAFGLERFFALGEEIIPYDDESDLVKLAHHFIGSTNERVSASSKAWEHAHREHTYDARLNKLLSIVR